MTGRERFQPCRRAQLITCKQLSSQLLSLSQRNPPASPHPATSQLTTHSTSPAAERDPKSQPLKQSPGSGTEALRSLRHLRSGTRGIQGQKNPADSSSMPPRAQQAARWDGCQPAAGFRRLRGSHAAGSTSLCMFLFCFTLQQGQQLLCSYFEREDELCSLAACGTGTAVSGSSGHPSPLPPLLDFPFTRSRPNPCPFQLNSEAARSINRIWCSSLRGGGNKQC